jgi:hypothetical protein
MDPVSLVVAALAAGAASGVGETASDAVRDAYAGLKELVRARLRGAGPGAEVVVADLAGAVVEVLAGFWCR